MITKIQATSIEEVMAETKEPQVLIEDPEALKKI